MSINRIFFTGNVGKQPEGVRQAGQSQVLEFSVASKDGYGSKEVTTWVKCQIWGNRAESLMKYINKGTRVAVDGRFKLTSREYKGNTYTDLICNVDQLAFSDSNNNSNQAPSNQPSNSGNTDYNPDDFQDSNVPF